MRRRIAFAVAIFGALGLALYLAVGHLLASDAARAAIARQLAARLGQPVRIASAAAWIYPRVGVDLRGVAIGDPATVQLEHLRVATGLRALFSRTIADAEVELSDGRVSLPLPFPLSGTSADAAEQSTSSAPLTIASIRTITLRGINLVSGAQTLQLDLQSALSGDRLEIRSLSAHADTTRIEATGTLTSISRLEGQLDARADPLDLDEMIAMVDALTASGAGSPAASEAGAARRGTTQPTLHLTIAMKAPTARFATYEVRNLSAGIEVAAGRVVLSPLSLGLFGGTVSGTLAVKTSGPAPQLRLDGRMDALDMRAIMDVSGAPGAITGRLAGTAGVSAEGSDSAALMRTARGTIDATIVDGELPHLDIVRSVVLAFGKPSGTVPTGSGTAFSKIGGAFALANGVLTSEDLTLNARDVDMRGRGSVQLASGALQASANVRLSPELTAQAGTDLRRYAQEDDRVVVPATIAGTLSRPAVSIDIAAAGRRALENELKRRATDWLGDLFRKKKGIDK